MSLNVLNFHKINQKHLVEIPSIYLLLTFTDQSFELYEITKLEFLFSAINSS